MASYYKTIDGKNYDRAILDMAKASVAGQGDGRISLNDAKKIVKLIQDGGRITDIEKRSLQYVLKKYKFTDTAEDHIKHALGKSAGIKEQKQVKKTVPSAKKTLSAGDAKKAKPAVAQKKQAVKAESPRKETAAAVALHDQLKAGTGAEQKKSLWKYILIALIVILLLLGIYYLYTKYKSRGIEQEQGAGIESDTTINTVEQQETAGELKSALEQKAPEKIKPEELADGKNRYVIKEGDTLVKISSEHYNDYKKWELIWKRNKGVLKSPILIYPGQVIELPEVK